MPRTSAIDIIKHAANDSLFDDTLTDVMADNSSLTRIDVMLYMMHRLRERKDVRPGYLKSMVDYVDARIEDGTLTRDDGRYRL